MRGLIIKMFCIDIIGANCISPGKLLLVKLTKGFLIICISAYSMSVSASYFNTENIYAGFSVGIGSSDFKNGYGKDFMPMMNPEADMFCFTRGVNKFGLELGMNSSFKPTDDVTIYSGQGIPGIPNFVGPDEWDTWRTSVESRTIYAGVNRYFSIDVHQDIHFFYLLALGLTQIRAEWKIHSSNDGTPTPEGIAESRRTFVKKKIHPLIKVGISFKLLDPLELSLSYNWKNYNSIGRLKSKENPGGASELRLQDSHMIHAGFVLKF